MKEKYMNLFAPDRRQSSLATAPNITTKRSRNDFEVLSPTKFKSPFTNLDPHSIHILRKMAMLKIRMLLVLVHLRINVSPSTVLSF